MIEDWRDFVWIDESDDRLSGARDDLVSEKVIFLLIFFQDKEVKLC